MDGFTAAPPGRRPLGSSQRCTLWSSPHARLSSALRPLLSPRPPPPSDTYAVVNTLRLPPRLLDTMVAVRLVALEHLGPLLDDGDGRGHFCCRSQGKGAVRKAAKNWTRDERGRRENLTEGNGDAEEREREYECNGIRETEGCGQHDVRAVSRDAHLSGLDGWLLQLLVRRG